MTAAAVPQKSLLNCDNICNFAATFAAKGKVESNVRSPVNKV